MSKDSSSRAHIAALRARDRADGQVQFRFNARVLAGSALIGALALGAVVISPPQIQADTEYGIAAFTSFLLSDLPSNPEITIIWHGQTARTGIKEWAKFQPLRQEAVSFARTLGLGGGLGFAGGMVGLWLTSDQRRHKQEERLADRVIRGTRVVSQTTLADMTAEENNEPRLQFGDVTLPSGLETRHVALIGTTGGGKSTLLRLQLDVIEARGEAALVYDTSGEFVANYYDPARGDIILNPFDQRGAFWSPFAEIIHPADADRIARYLINETGDEERDIWLETSRNLVANIMRNLWREGRGTLQALLNALQSMPQTELKHWLANTSSARSFEKDADRATASVLFMLVKAVNMLMFLRKAPRDGERSFSISQFFKGIDQHKGRKPWTFVPRQEDFFEAVKPLMALWLECAASAMLGLSASPTRRVWFLLDELADLPRVENLERLLPQGRKFGACAILSFQTIGQMRGHYGPDGAEALLGCCNTKLFLQMSDHASREWASATIGGVEVEIPTLAEMFDPKTGKPQRTLSTMRELRAAVLESDLRLPKHTGYLLLPDGLPVARIKLTNDHIITRGPARQPDFIPADIAETLWGGLQEAQETLKAKTPDAPIQGTILGPGPV
ncbi:type IV secretion system DNA-binding domain-containing protein [Acidiphilium iwatense]|uniref:Type IV secretion system DNA-binding domain-containing protein n=1 Tax=Acidiphilium iwatense TaxID=768198 RepID=A0ABS9E1B3_9PROT|nr:type IV secretion system DNA-binding domain-containing protein [Acidiphilium iwatense]MCF3948803.1 type IV secretion system DNA-binding domain-containing protein [Acidiphilium iwatense]